MVIFVAIAAFAIILDQYIYPLPVRHFHKPHAQFIYGRDGKLLTAFASSDHFWRKPVKLEQISPDLVRRVIACEDRWFYYHPGFNPVSLLAAAIENLETGKIVRGGSTITMQIARMMEPKSRTVKNKLIEILRSLQLEVHYSKNELLEIYLNLVPYGGNIEGIGAASHFYFGKKPDHLTVSETAILTAIPASPNKYRPDIDRESCRKRRDHILDLLYAREEITQLEYNCALNEEVPVRRLDRPFTAPHFCRSLASRYPGLSEITTTLDPALQLISERLSSQHLATLRNRGIHNVSVVVIDNNTGELLVQVGSPDFTDSRHSGQINGALARRSPGSALKPFVYALGFENGVITPSSRLDDIPVSYGGYRPENYDETYHGSVSVNEALIRSLNVPAVNLTSQIGLHRYYGLLRAGGITSLRGEYYDYGLPLVLGACEVSLMELSNLYATLAREGVYRPINQIHGSDPNPPEQLLSRESCYIISTILAELQRPDLPTTWEFTRDLPTVAWKTGTSYGRRDAWAVGYNPKFTIGVWAGNFSGESSPYLVGAEAAAPLMLSLFRETGGSADPTWFKKPGGVGVRDVCTVSGCVPGKYCPSIRQELYIPQVSSCAICPVHRQLIVDRHTGHMLCRACTHGKQVDSIIVEEWPARLSAWLLEHGAIPHTPGHNPLCRGVIVDDNPVIVSPENGAVFEIQAAIPREYQKILLEASAALNARKLHWFLDKELYASAPVGSPIFYAPRPGRHTLMCVDDLGRSSRISFEVR
jgi:penicillin-binding protein 1C